MPSHLKRVVTLACDTNLYSKADTNISQGSAAKRLKCGGIFNDNFIANLLLYFFEPLCTQFTDNNDINKHT